jgi:hypothetical protein
MKRWTKKQERQFSRLAECEASGALQPADIPTFKRLLKIRRQRRAQEDRKVWWTYVKQTRRLKRMLMELGNL